MRSNVMEQTKENMSSFISLLGTVPDKQLIYCINWPLNPHSLVWSTNCYVVRIVTSLEKNNCTFSEKMEKILTIFLAIVGDKKLFVCVCSKNKKYSKTEIYT